MSSDSNDATVAHKWIQCTELVKELSLVLTIKNDSFHLMASDCTILGVFGTVAEVHAFLLGYRHTVAITSRAEQMSRNCNYLVSCTDRICAALEPEFIGTWTTRAKKAVEVAEIVADKKWHLGLDIGEKRNRKVKTK